jgi:diacylglycerol kinase family enzyme
MDAALFEIDNFFKSAGSRDYTVHIIRFPWDATGFIRSFMKTVDRETTVRVYSMGGDTMLFDCLNGVMGFDNTELAVMPFGRENIFMRGFGKRNWHLFRDVSRQIAAGTIPLDVIRYGNNYGLNFCSFGLEGHACLQIQKFQEFFKRSGPLFNWLSESTYSQLSFVGAFMATIDKKNIKQYYELEIDGENFSGERSLIYIANGAWNGPDMYPAPYARPDDGELDIILIRPGKNLFDVFRNMPAYLKGRITGNTPGLELRQGRKIVLRSPDPLVINLDDIVFFDTDTTVEVLPGALRFVDVTGNGYLGGGGINNERL